MLKFFAGILWMLMFVSCLFNDSSSNEEVAGGGSDLPEITGIIHSENGSAASNTRVRVYAGNFTSGLDPALIQQNQPLIAETTSDENGVFQFDSLPGGEHYLEFISLDSLEMAQTSTLDIVPGSTLNMPPVQLGPAARLDLQWQGGSDLPDKIFIAGTHYSSQNFTGPFSMVLEPGREYRLVARFNTADEFVYVPGKHFTLNNSSLSLGSVSAAPNELLLFDFESNDAQNYLRGIAYDQNIAWAGNWRINEISITQFIDGPGDSTNFLTSNDSYQGLSLYMYDRATGSFKIAQNYTDLRNMTALKFYAKGPGNLRVFFRSQRVQEGDGSLEASLVLTDTWVQYIIPDSNILPPTGSQSAAQGLTWSDISTGIFSIDFAYSGGAGFTLDNIIIEGMTYTDFLP